MIRPQKITAILLITVYLFSATATREFLKMPLLIEHYKVFKSHFGDGGLLFFLTHHYLQHDVDDFDATEDERLPFKSVPELVVSGFTALEPPLNISIAKLQVHHDIIRVKLINDVNIAFGFGTNIWRPPRS